MKEKSGEDPLRALVGKVVFLDFTPPAKLKECLRRIKSRIEDCLSKKVDCVITNRDLQSLTDDQTEKKKVLTSPNSLRMSMVNRAQTILEKGSKTDVLNTARKLGIRIISFKDLERHIEKYLTNKEELKTVKEKEPVFGKTWSQQNFFDSKSSNSQKSINYLN